MKRKKYYTVHEKNRRLVTLFRSLTDRRLEATAVLLDSKMMNNPSFLSNSTFNKIFHLLANHAFLTGLTIRFLLMIILPIIMDDGLLLQGVKYTDIDYDVFTDAADHVANGRSPFQRHTYRYTPFIAWILSFASDSKTGSWWRDPKYFGKIIFCIADSSCGWIIMKLKQRSRRQSTKEKHSSRNDKDKAALLQDACWWLYNPLPINICTRGSGESFVVLLPVLFTLVTVISMSQKSSTCTKRYHLWVVSIMAGILHGIAIHAKLYPIIYTISFMAYISLQEQSMITNRRGDTELLSEHIGWCQRMPPVDDESRKDTYHSKLKQRRNYPFPWTNTKRLVTLIGLWTQRLLFTIAPLLFLIVSMVTFGTLTYLAVKLYGDASLHEGLLYHFSRLDHRHNYSMFWYWIYLARGKVSAQFGGEVSSSLSSSSLTIMSRGLLLPQIVLLLYSSLGIAPYDLPFALFLQTFSFVAQNKVMTAQYFTWYLVLLPLCSERIFWKTKSMVCAAGLLGLSILSWLGFAFRLEMLGLAVHLQVWLASVVYFMANVNLLRVIMNHYRGFCHPTSGKQD